MPEPGEAGTPEESDFRFRAIEHMQAEVHKTGFVRAANFAACPCVELNLANRVYWRRPGAPSSLWPVGCPGHLRASQLCSRRMFTNTARRQLQIKGTNE